MLSWVWQRVLLHRWRTLLLTLGFLLFPRLVAMLLTAMVRLLVRALVAVMVRLFAELGQELRELCVQMSVVSSSFGDYLISYVEELFSPPAVAPPNVGPQGGPSPPAVPAPPAAVPAPHPFHWLSSFLLIVDIFLRVRPMAGAG